MRVDSIGTVAPHDCMTTFAKIHLQLSDGGAELCEKLNDLYLEVCGGELAPRSLAKMFGAPGFLKTFTVKAEQVAGHGLTDGKDRINYLAFAAGVWLEDENTLYKEDFAQEWLEIGYKYLNNLYKSISDDDIETIHA